MDRRSSQPAGASSNKRLYIWYGAIFLMFAVIILRLFYLQIIRHDYYQKQALADQQKQYTIAAERGVIEAHQQGQTVPLVLNEKLYTLYADPTIVKSPQQAANKLCAITKGDSSQYASLMKTKNTRYVILAKRLNSGQMDAITKLKLPGVGLQAQDYRTYPDGDLASQILGFVNSDEQGTYGIEQNFNKQLAGTPGRVKAITDASGVPLAASRDNVQISPKAGQSITLSIDVSMQQKLEAILKQGLQNARSKSGSAVIIDPYSGKIQAMANWPSFDASKYYQTTDISAFNDAAISSQLEVGSIMKTLTMSAALDQKVVTPDTAFHDPGYVNVDGFTIKNVEGVPTDPVNMKDVLKYSLNTGAVWVLKQMGGGAINTKARNIWHDYMVNHYQLGKPTGIELPSEAAGSVPDPNKGYGLNLQYANTAFGQGMSATLLQMAAAISSVVNGGTYYKPSIVDSVGSSQTKPQIVRQHVISPAASSQIRDMLQYVFEQNHTGYSSDMHAGYVIGGKTGTAQIPAPGGGYKDGVYNGTFIGFVGGNRPQYVMAVLVNAPDLPGYETAGAMAAAPIFGQIENMLINDFNVLPKTN